MIPGPRPSKGHDRPSAGRDRGPTPSGSGPAGRCPGGRRRDLELPDRVSWPERPRGLPVALTRTSRGWSVSLPGRRRARRRPGRGPLPGRPGRRGARCPLGARPHRPPLGPRPVGVVGRRPTDPVDARVAALERTVAQLEHALAARVSTERAIGVLAERHGIERPGRLRDPAPRRPLPGAPGGRPRPRGPRRAGRRRRAACGRRRARGAGAALRHPASRRLGAPRARTPPSLRRTAGPDPAANRSPPRPWPTASPASWPGLRPEPGAAALRVAVDGPDVAAAGASSPPASPTGCPPLGRPAVVVPAAGFYRPASLRLEHGRTDPDARYTDWLDAGALAREVLDPGRPGRLRQLPAGAVGPRARPRRPGAVAGRCRRAASCWCPARCCRASGWRSTSSSTCGSAPAARRRLHAGRAGLGAARVRPVRRRGRSGRPGRRRRARRPRRPAGPRPGRPLQLNCCQRNPVS